MTLFERQLQRLKECLRVTEDQEVARALGMSKAAFSYRKRVASFPAEKLFALKAKHADLDLQYVLLGERLGAAERRDHDQFMSAAHALGLDPTLVAKAIADGAESAKYKRARALEHPSIAALLETLHWCDDESIELLLQVARRFRSNTHIPVDERAQRPAKRPAAPKAADTPRRATGRRRKSP